MACNARDWTCCFTLRAKLVKVIKAVIITASVLLLLMDNIAGCGNSMINLELPLLSLCCYSLAPSDSFGRC